MFSPNFLTDLARKYELSPEQEEVFLLWWGNGKGDREISEQLHVTAEAIRNRKTGIYKKFSIAGSGANKSNKLRNWLEAEVKKQNVQADFQPNFVDLGLQIQEVKQKITGLWKDLPLPKLNELIKKKKSQHEELKKSHPDSSQLDKLVAETKELESLLARKHELEFLLDSLVQEVKPKIAADVAERCGTMRVLDMTQPVDLDRIYTDVN
ncbi:MAG: helix-turn-helix transcriptional regulator, partial [Pseudanabaenaceae cyanobacterium]